MLYDTVQFGHVKMGIRQVNTNTPVAYMCLKSDVFKLSKTKCAIAQRCLKKVQKIQSTVHDIVVQCSFTRVENTQYY